MIAIENAKDFEFYSSTSSGTMQGLGYECRDAGYVPIKDHQSQVLTISQASIDSHNYIHGLVNARPYSR